MNAFSRFLQGIRWRGSDYSSFHAVAGDTVAASIPPGAQSPQSTAAACNPRLVARAGTLCTEGKVMFPE